MDDEDRQTWPVAVERFALGLIGIGCLLVIVAVVWWVSRPAVRRTPTTTTTTTSIAPLPTGVQVANSSTEATTDRQSLRPSPRLAPAPGGSERISLQSGTTLAGRVVTLDPGHNGGNAQHPTEVNALVPAGGFLKACDTTGTETSAGFPEHAFTYDLALRVASILRARGATVVLTRHSDGWWGPCVNRRAAIGNDVHADAALSIHADGGPPAGRGFHVLEPGGGPGRVNSIVLPSKPLGHDLRDAFAAGTGMPVADYIGTNGLQVRTDLGGLNLSTVPKVFIECGNMRNGTDVRLLSSATWRQRAALAIADGLTRFLRSR